MGNRAFITVGDGPEVGTYLHWNGGPESVYAFADAALEFGCLTDSGLAFLARAFFGLSRLNVYVMAYDNPDDATGTASDNGLYMLPDNPEGDSWAAQRWTMAGEHAERMSEAQAQAEAAEARAHEVYGEIREHLRGLVAGLEAARAA